MTTERSGNFAAPLAGLPLFTQPFPPVAERLYTARHVGAVAPLSTVSGSRIGRDVDWSLVSALRAQASEQLSQAVAADRGRLDKAAQEELGRSIVLDLIESTVADRVNAGSTTLPVSEQDALARAVFDSLFRLGRLQPLVDEDRVENIIITGHDNVLLEVTDGSLVDGPPVADSDEELIDFLVFLASRSEVNARGFSEAQPRLHLRLDGGSRLAAAAWVTPRPSIVIRRHRLMEVTLDDLVARQMLTSVAASFLRAAVKARKSIVVSGSQGAGKTTMVRALCAEIDPLDAIGTFETEYELHLHELRDRHRIVHPWEARPGSGERGADGRQAGEFTLDEALVDSFRFNLSRQIVGEVRGKEIWAMIKAMESGTGSISTTHASDAVAAIRKLVTCAMEAGPHITHALATSKLASTINLIVHLDLRTVNEGGRSTRRRRVAEIIALDPGERETGYATTHVFAPEPDGTAGPAVLPDDYRSLSAYGFDLAGYLAQQGGAVVIVLVPALAGALVVGGLIALFTGLRPSSVVDRPSRPRKVRKLSNQTRILLLSGFAAGVVAFLVTGWLLALLVVPVAFVGLPVLLSSSSAAARVERLEAMEEWTRSLSGVLTVGVGLEQALVATLRSTPAAIAPEVTRLVARLRARWVTEDALRAFADDLDDATGDLVAANLILGARRRGAGLASVLEGLAESVAADVRARRQVEADRAKPRATARWVTIISVGVLVVLAVSRTYIEPYQGPLGQVILVSLLSAYVATLAWMKRMAIGRAMPRFLSPVPTRDGAA